MDAFLLTTLSFISLLTIAGGVYLISEKTKFPYTVALVAFGMVIAFLTKIPTIAFLDDFELTPSVLLYVFLPILLFESAYNIRYKELLRNIRSISLLAVVSLVISAFIIAFLFQWILGFFGLHVPFIVTLLFGSLISATDPVAVLALFKQLGAPRRLTLIFEGESLFNDGTALALFLVILSFAVAQWGWLDSAGHTVSLFEHFFAPIGSSIPFSPEIIKGFLSFVIMITWGILFGGFIGIIFSKVIEKIKNQEFLEITLTLILAHTTFILSEVINHFLFPVSGVIATTIAAMVIGNYGRYKITPKVEETMEHFWWFFAFLSNSLVFLLIGIMVITIKIDVEHLILPISVSIIVVMIARAISVYSVIGLLNFSKTEASIPMTWQHLLSWGSLRGALAIIMVLLIPADLTLDGWTLPYSVRDFVLAVTVGCIVFTTFIKATTITPMMRWFKVDQLHEVEEMGFIEWKMLMLVEVLAKITKLHDKGYISFEERELLKSGYEDEFKKINIQLKAFMDKKGDDFEPLIRRVVTLHALGIEKFWLKSLYRYNEISEKEFKTLIRKIRNQIHRIETGKEQIKSEGEEIEELDFLERSVEKISDLISPKQNPILGRYMRARARQVTAEKVLKELFLLEGIDFIAGRAEFKKIRTLYKGFQEKAKNERRELFEKHKELLLPFDSHLVNKSLLKAEEHVIKELHEKEIISPKLHIRFQQDIEQGIYS